MRRHHTHRHLAAPSPLLRVGRPAPRAGIDPISCAADALAVLSVAVADPLRSETIVFALDHDGIGDVITIISDTHDCDAVLRVVEVVSLATSHSGRLRGLVVASVRPEGAVMPGDVDRWLEASAIADEHGIDLIEWFVVGPAGAECPRELIGEPERW